MGCDIHLALERRLVNKDKKFYYMKYNSSSGEYEPTEDVSKSTNYMKEHILPKWRPCPILGSVEIGSRIYGMFSNLANVRSEDLTKDYPEPKGFPWDANQTIIEEYTYLVDNDLGQRYDEGKTYIKAMTEEKAEWWLDHGAKIIDNLEQVDKSRRKRITYPECHSASWVSRQELEDAYNELYQKEYNGETVYIGEHDYYYGIISLMKAFEDNGDYEVRMVFWFDN